MECVCAGLGVYRCETGACDDLVGSGTRSYEDACFWTARADLNADAFELFDEGLAADPECAGNM